MIQRIQTLYLLLSAILATVCLARPIRRFTTADSLPSAPLYKLRTVTPAGAHSLAPWALFALLLLAAALTLIAVFLFKTRALQMRVASLAAILLAGYYAWYVAFALLHTAGGSFRPTAAAALPFASLVLNCLAFRSILRDELLVRSLNRLR